MTPDWITAAFEVASINKAKSSFAVVDLSFLVIAISLTTPAQGAEGVKVAYLYADRDEPPTSLEEASYYDVFVLEIDGQEGLAMPVPMLVERNTQLADKLFAVAEFRPRGDLAPIDDEDCDDYETDGWSNLLEV